MRPGVPALPLFSLGGFLVPSVAPGPSGGGLVSLEYASRYSRGSFSPIRQKAHSHIHIFQRYTIRERRTQLDLVKILLPLNLTKGATAPL